MPLTMQERLLPLSRGWGSSEMFLVSVESQWKNCGSEPNSKIVSAKSIWQFCWLLSFGKKNCKIYPFLRFPYVCTPNLCQSSPAGSLFFTAAYLCFLFFFKDKWQRQDLSRIPCDVPQDTCVGYDVCRSKSANILKGLHFWLDQLQLVKNSFLVLVWGFLSVAFYECWSLWQTHGKEINTANF